MTRDECMTKADYIIVRSREEELEVLEKVKELDEALNEFCWSGLYKIVDNRVLRNLHMLLGSLRKDLEIESFEDVELIENQDGEPIEKIVIRQKQYPYNLYTIRSLT